MRYLYITMRSVKFNATEEFFRSLPVNDLEMYIELGNKAMEKGDVDTSIKWYQKGLKKAIELCNDQKVREFSGLIVTLL